MEEYDSVKSLNQKIFVLQKKCNEKDFMEEVYSREIDSLNDIKKKLEDINAQDKVKMEKLQNRVASLSHQLNDVELQEQQNKTVVIDLESRVEILRKDNEKLKEKLKTRINSPTEVFVNDHFKCKKEISGLQAEVENSTEFIKLLQQRDTEQKQQFQQDLEVLKSQVEESRRLLDVARDDKEELEGELMTLQNESATADFSKKGNNMYNELDDRRVKAEKLLASTRAEVTKHTSLSANLRVFIQHAFKSFSQLKEDKYRETRRIMTRDLDQLSSENKRLQKQLNILQKGIEEGLSSDVTLCRDVLNLEIKNLKRLVVDNENRRQEAENRLIQKLNEREIYLVNSVNLKKEIADLNLKLACWNNLADESLKSNFESILQETQLILKQNQLTQNNKETILPGQKVDPNSETLEMDNYGVPIENRLIQAIRKSLLEPVSREVEIQCDLLNAPKDVLLDHASVEDPDSVVINQIARPLNSPQLSFYVVESTTANQSHRQDNSISASKSYQKLNESSINLNVSVSANKSFQNQISNLNSSAISTKKQCNANTSLSELIEKHKLIDREEDLPKSLPENQPENSESNLLASELSINEEKHKLIEREEDLPKSLPENQPENSESNLLASELSINEENKENLLPEKSEEVSNIVPELEDMETDCTVS